MDFKEVLKNKEYDFLRENKYLGNNIILLTLGGSYAYGTNKESGSDLDCRGIALNATEDILGFYAEPKFEQIVDVDTDTTVYSLSKMVRLLCDNNPNTIEILGCKPEHYLHVSKEGQILLDNKDAFLSKRAIHSFVSYARAQLGRLENAVARDSLPQKEKEKHILNSCLNAMGSFNERYRTFENGYLKLYVGDSDKADLTSEIFCDVNLSHYPLRDFNGFLNELGSISRSYNKVNHRNHKKDEAHLNKHIMHLFRLYIMGYDIIANKQIITYREDEHDFLMSIRNGLFLNSDGTINPKMYEELRKLEDKLEYAIKHTELPDAPDYKTIEEMVYKINKNTINRS